MVQAGVALVLLFGLVVAAAVAFMERRRDVRAEMAWWRAQQDAELFDWSQEPDL